MSFRWATARSLQLLALFALAGLATGVGYADEVKAESAALPAAEIDKKIIAEVKEKAELKANLQYLCDTIGPRVTGSAKLEQANKWAAEKMKSYGLTNVKLEPWEIPVAWERGTFSMKMVEPNAGKALTGASAAWTPGTKGKITGEVVFLEAKTKDDLAKYKGKLNNAIVMRNAPADVKPISDLTYLAPPVPRPTTPMVEPKKDEPKKDEPKKVDPPKVDPPKPPETNPQPNPRPNFGEMQALRAAIGEFLKAEGAAAILTDSAKPHGLLTMSGSWPRGDRGTATDPLPTIYMAHEDYTLLHRLATAKDGKKPTVELEITNKFVPGPITVYNTVGEILGKTQKGQGAGVETGDAARNGNRI